MRDVVSEANQLASKDLIPFFRIEMEGVPMVPGIGSGAFVMFVIWLLSRIKFALPVTLSHWPSKEDKALNDKSMTIGLVPSVPELYNLNGPLMMDVILLDLKFITKEGHPPHITLITDASKFVKLLFVKFMVTPVAPLIEPITSFEIDVI